MPVHNAAPYLALSIESILKQSFTDFEFIIISDGSTDSSLQILREYAQKDARIHLLVNEKNLGETPTRNVGLNVSRGKYIAAFDADDISMPDRLKLQKEFLDTHPEIFLVGSRAEIIDQTGKVMRNPKIMVESERLSEAMPRSNFIFHPSIMFRNNPVFRYREKIPYVGDYDFHLNLLSSGKKLANLPETLIQYRLHGDSISDTKSLKQILLAEKVREMYQARITTGRDDYDSFDATEILTVDEEKVIENEKYLQMLIDNAVKRMNPKKVRHYTKKYIQRFGLRTKNTKLFLLSCVAPLFRLVLGHKK